jgi:hypothetical protein
MGTFRSLSAELPCERCHRVRPVDVQFKTGSDWQERYVLGQLVQEQGPMEIGKGYPATLERFCADCSDAYWLDEAMAKHEALARLVEQGRLGIRPRGTATDLSPQQLRNRGETKATELRERQGLPWRSVEGLNSFDMSWDGIAVERRDFDRYLEVVRELNQLIAQLMERNG